MKLVLWPCACGRHHAPWWRTVQAPTCNIVKPWTKRYVSLKVPQ